MSSWWAPTAGRPPEAASDHGAGPLLRCPAHAPLAVISLVACQTYSSQSSAALLFFLKSVSVHPELVEGVSARVGFDRLSPNGDMRSFRVVISGCCKRRCAVSPIHKRPVSTLRLLPLHPPALTRLASDRTSSRVSSRSKERIRLSCMTTLPSMITVETSLPRPA